MSNQLHAHVFATSRDCDGSYESSYVVTFNDDEIAESGKDVNDFSDIHFMERVLGDVASPYTARQTTVKMDEEGIEVHEVTEEGYRAADVSWCRDNCETEARTFRDHTAESMGY